MGETKAFRCSIPRHDGSAIVFASSASKARYITYLHASDVWDGVALIDVRVKRAPEWDGKQPERDRRRAIPTVWSEDALKGGGDD